MYIFIIRVESIKLSIYDLQDLEAIVKIVTFVT